MTEPTEANRKLYRKLGWVMTICAVLGLVIQFVRIGGLGEGEYGPVYWWALTITFVALGICGVYFLTGYGRGGTKSYGPTKPGLIEDRTCPRWLRS